MKDMEITPPPWLNQPDPLLEQAKVLMKMTESLAENQKLVASLRLLLLALVDTAQDMPALVRAYRVRLGEQERLTGQALQPLIPID